MLDRDKGRHCSSLAPTSPGVSMRSSSGIAALILVVASFALPAQVPADLTQAFKARDQAIDKVDVAAWERVTAAGFIVVDDTGRRLTRAERLTQFKKSKPATTVSTCGQQ